MNYPSIRIEGAILSPDILGQIEELPGQRPTDFALDASTKVKDEIARAWADAQDLSLPFIPSIAETLEFCITTGYPFRHA